MGSGRDGPHNCGWSDDCRDCNEDRIRWNAERLRDAQKREEAKKAAKDLIALAKNLRARGVCENGCVAISNDTVCELRRLARLADV